jgi:COMPASS component SWD3
MNAYTAADKTIKIWDARTGKHEHTLEAHMAGVSDVDWAPDSLTLVSGSDDKTVRLWDVHAVTRLPPPPPEIAADMCGIGENVEDSQRPS